MIQCHIQAGSHRALKILHPARPYFAAGDKAASLNADFSSVATGADVGFPLSGATCLCRATTPIQQGGPMLSGLVSRGRAQASPGLIKPWVVGKAASAQARMGR
jgi:hypothetical protein